MENRDPRKIKESTFSPFLLFRYNLKNRSNEACTLRESQSGLLQNSIPAAVENGLAGGISLVQNSRASISETPIENIRAYCTLHVTTRIYVRLFRKAPGLSTI